MEPAEPDVAEAPRGIGRIVSFSDGVVAIAATLLVLPLVDIAGDIETMRASDLLSANGSALLVFALSFLVIYHFWLVHNRVFENVIGYTQPLLWVNCLWLMSIVFLPFPTQLIGAPGEPDRLTHALYIGTMLVTTTSASLTQLIIKRTPTIQAPAARGRLSLVPALTMTAAMAAALIVAVAVPAIGLWSLLLLLVAGVTEGQLSKRRQR